MELTLR